MGLLNHNDWRVDDNYPDLMIDDIEKFSEKLNSIHSRISDRSKLNPSHLNIRSVIQMTQALEYHQTNFKKKITQSLPFSFPLKNIDITKITEAKFEAIAYINTVGQLYYWERSIDSITHKVEEITESFRHSYTAHTSSHNPRGESKELKQLHLIAFVGGTLWNSDGELILQIQKRLGQSTNFNLIADHKLIMEEILKVFKQWLK